MAQNPDPKAIARLIRAIQCMREETGNPELQAQSMLFFLFVGLRHPAEVPFQEAEKLLGLSQTAISRNAQYFGKGLERANQTNPKKTDTLGGYGLIKVAEDPFYVKRKLMTLTPAGLALLLKVVKHMVADQ